MVSVPAGLLGFKTYYVDIDGNEDVVDDDTPELLIRWEPDRYATDLDYRMGITLEIAFRAGWCAGAVNHEMVTEAGIRLTQNPDAPDETITALLTQIFETPIKTHTERNRQAGRKLVVEHDTARHAFVFRKANS